MQIYPNEVSHLFLRDAESENAILLYSEGFSICRVPYHRENARLHRYLCGAESFQISKFCGGSSSPIPSQGHDSLNQFSIARVQGRRVARVGSHVLLVRNGKKIILPT